MVRAKSKIVPSDYMGRMKPLQYYYETASCQLHAATESTMIKKYYSCCQLQIYISISEGHKLLLSLLTLK
jgi:hypothetical protein